MLYKEKTVFDHFAASIVAELCDAERATSSEAIVTHLDSALAWSRAIYGVVPFQRAAWCAALARTIRADLQDARLGAYLDKERVDPYDAQNDLGQLLVHLAFAIRAARRAARV